MCCFFKNLFNVQGLNISGYPYGRQGAIAITNKYKGILKETTGAITTDKKKDAAGVSPATEESNVLVSVSQIDAFLK